MGALEDDLDYALKIKRLSNLSRVRMNTIWERSLTEAAVATLKYPQPNKVLLKVAEEAGEVVKAGVHLSEGRDFKWSDLEDEVVQIIAMCIRLISEGDRTIGLVPPPEAVE